MLYRKITSYILKTIWNQVPRRYLLVGGMPNAEPIVICYQFLRHDVFCNRAFPNRHYVAPIEDFTSDSRIIVYKTCFKP